MNGLVSPESASPRRQARSGLRSLRIALVSYSLPGDGRKTGGIERVAHDLAQGLSARGHEVTVWSYDEAPSGARYGVKRLPARAFATSWLGLRLTSGYLGNVFSALPDYTESDAIIAMGDSLLLPMVRKPLIRVMHGSALGEALSAKSPWRFALQMGVYAQELISAAVQRGTVGVSENSRERNPFVRRVIPNGIDLTRFSPDAEAKTEEPTILFVGTLAGRKRGDHLLSWFREHVRPAHPTARLVMVTPPGEDEPGVTYRTGISGEELARLYREAWVYASPSSYEGFGLPYVEAMASGTPVLATPNPGSREVLAGGKFGILASDEDFPRELNRLLGSGELRASLVEAGLARARTYSLESMLDSYEELLDELCRPSSNRMKVAA